MSGSGIVIFEKNLEEKADEAIEAAKAAQRERFKKKLTNEYNDWLAQRQYVRDNMHKLMNTLIPVEITSIQDIADPHNCVVINDMVLFPYKDIYEELKRLEEEQNKLENADGKQIADG